MAWRIEKTGKDMQDLVWSAVETGIAPSPTKGTANIQNANISTEMGEIMNSYGRIQQSQPGTVAASQTATAISTTRLSTTFAALNGTQITVTASSVSGLSTGNYFVVNSSATTISNGGVFQLGSIQTSGFGGVTSWAGSSGTITFHITTAMSQPVAYATEVYNASTQQYRYYVLDSVGLVWVYDTALINNQVTGQLFWYLPNPDTTYFSGGTVPSGIAVLNGWLMVFGGATIYCKPTVNLAGNFTNFINGGMSTLPTGTTPHFAYVGHQGKCYYTDGNYLGEIFPDTSLLTISANIQSFCSYTAVTITGTVSTVISGSLPTDGLPTGSGGIRVPAVFFTDVNGVQPTNLSTGTIYYIEMNNGTANFQVFAAASGGSAIDIKSGASGNQYFNTFYPISAGGATTITYTPQRLNLPTFEVAQCMTEVGNNIVIGGIGNILYPWNQVDPLPGSLISLPETNTTALVTVNQMVYSFTGNKGNIYITDGSVASLVIKVPDYCAGIPGTPSSYVEPYFTWGGAAYIRGRVYFSILDQTSSKTGNCGGVWSFVPTQNLYIGQDTGLALRLENQNSYGTYNGVSVLLIPSQTQNANSPQYWAAWYSSISSPAFGIDFTYTLPTSVTLFETDLAPTGTLLNKASFAQLEYKVSTPLASGDTIQAYYRLNSTDAYVTCGTVNEEAANRISGYFGGLPFQNTQWVQFQVKLTSNNASNTSFCRLTELRLR